MNGSRIRALHLWEEETKSDICRQFSQSAAAPQGGDDGDGDDETDRYSDQD